MLTKDSARSTDHIIYANPTKDFFVNMITRDIALVDCIFDLLDNAIDGARRNLSDEPDKQFSAFKIELNFGKENFKISDNCGGITLSDAVNYAFHFGRRPRKDGDVKGGIGLYGIGMKRAIFKIGKLAQVTSHAPDASFKVNVDVVDWIAKEDDWEFMWSDEPKAQPTGTTIEISKLNSGVGESFDDIHFKNELVKSISRDYAFFINKGLIIKVGGTEVPSYQYGLKSNESIVPGVDIYNDDGVNVRIVAGLLEELPDDIPEDIAPTLVERFGWYVICNDRVVLAGDKTDKTVWGHDNFPVWHPQYAGFAGFVFFQCDDQNKLPWTTTKRDLDDSNPLYRRTIAKMKTMTSVFTKYSNQRKSELEKAKEVEKSATLINVYGLTHPISNEPAKQLKLPDFSQKTTSEPPLVTISFKRSRSEIEEIKSHAGNILMSAKDVGHLTFDYYLEVELGK